MKPVIILTFANYDKSSHLHLLKEESRKLMEILGDLHDKEAIEVFREESSTTDDLINLFNRFDQRICIFHYAGHASGKTLEMEEGSAYASGLSKLLAHQKNNLALVFLNGCSTASQVEALLDLGVKSVLATSVKIEDAKAVEFANWFYKALSVQRTLKDAFEFASANLTTKYKDIGKDPEVIYRDVLFDLRDSGSIQQDEFPWALYVNKDHKDILNWRLPNAPESLDNYLVEGDFQVNDHLNLILEQLLFHNPAIEEDLYDRHGEPIDEREYPDIIIKNFPWTIGAQLQKLVSYSDGMGNPGLPRLKQIISTYLISTQLLLYLGLSETWEILQQKKKQGELDVLDPLSLNKESWKEFDYLNNFKKLEVFFTERKPFVSEFQSIFTLLNDEGSELYNAYLNLESIKDGLFSESITPLKASQLCERAEYYLAIFIKELAFLVKYRIISVRDIQINFQRHKEIEFQHKMGGLNAYSEKRLTLFREPKGYKNYLHNNSVLLVKSLQDVDEFLSLSPFVIDKNSFTNTTQESLNIYIYAYNEDGEYNYHHVNSNIFNREQNLAGKVFTGFELKNESKKGIRYQLGVKGVKKMEVLRPYESLKEQFEAMIKDFSTG